MVYDIYRINPHSFGFGETTDFKHFTNLGHLNKGVMKATNFSVPKHPATMQFTAKEAQQLGDAWGLNMRF